MQVQLQLREQLQRHSHHSPQLFDDGVLKYFRYVSSLRASDGFNSALDQHALKVAHWNAVATTHLSGEERHVFTEKCTTRTGGESTVTLGFAVDPLDVVVTIQFDVEKLTHCYDAKGHY